MPATIWTRFLVFPLAVSERNNCSIQNYKFARFTFSKPCIVIHIHEKDQQYAHFFSLIYSNWTILYMFQTNKCSSSGGYFCTRSIQYFTIHLAANTITSCWQLDTHRYIIKILYAACTEITSWWWTIICSNHVEDSLIGINWWEKVCILLVFLTYKFCLFFDMGVKLGLPH